MAEGCHSIAKPLKPRLKQLLDLLPQHDWVISRAAVHVGYSESYATKRLPRRLAHDVSFCVAVEIKRREFVEATGWDEAKWRQECVQQYEEAKAAKDRPAACRLLRMIGQNVGAFSPDKPQEGQERSACVVLTLGAGQAGAIVNADQGGHE